jgi:hypothetical protein
MASRYALGMERTTQDQATKVRENRLRRVAERQGFLIRKSRRRDPRALDYGERWLLRFVVFDHTGIPQAVANPEQRHDAWFGPFADLDAVEAFLTGSEDGER